ncbi:GNAT family N-acetyltransferase [Endozoicomonas sp. ALD040]|uniref:GNAT family N-acetyltransferase n=1 Tax=unclassified Endozoicomonas TaxID=2644528 RepID=UPI003BB00482
MDFFVPKVLETERLILRQFEDGDWVDLHKYYCDSVATKFTTGRSFTEGETWRAMAGMIGHWQLRGYGPYAVVEKSSNAVLGPVGFWYPNDWPSPEIKWALAPEFWGHGFAKEATLIVQATGKKYMPDLSLISFIHSENLASIKLAKSVGANLEKETEFRGGLWQIYRHPHAT